MPYTFKELRVNAVRHEMENLSGYSYVVA